MAAPNPQDIANQFVDFYYNTFDNNRAGLAALYRDSSMLSFESSQFQGAQNISEKLQSLPFQRVVHKVDTKDVQPSSQQGGIIVLVTGALQFDDSPQPMSFAQTFQLLPEGGNWFVQNDIFKLIYPAS
ncbi:uncharacterized protein HMPREF1541_04163 [Cyphellophora europaea CBS 101466]|uniref:Nuclear transport factor 2 n=1 Tax=Cyphellophora europaea (strain CBS 101466) TaxID=1220924 RepID=W2S0L7_CYPE1|nr:uncharacterized protein HMPREF1541_04163 [Cyphellophora europaea CBS 101466]ETN42222.1 hypothetical protein HMPREF1541_04163 [Cyphellophora europaea CBS 101466]